MSYEELLDKVYDAYFDCWRHKKGKKSAIEFSMDYGSEIRKLTRELYDGSYRISKSIVFGVTRPKDREVFAAAFRDRVVHHLIMTELMWILEGEMIDDSYNCREGKGTTYGVTRLQQQIRKVSDNYKKDAWTLCLDIQGFFMSIDKEKCWQMVERVVRDKWRIGNVEWWLKIIRMIILNRPELNCEVHGDPRILQRLPDNKTLFRSDGKGLPIGNLTSQIFGNYYMTPFDHWLMSLIEGKAEYGRYVDDMRITSTNKDYLLSLIQKIKTWLKENLSVTLHPRKICLQEVHKGVTFLGCVITPHGLHCGNRTVNNAFAVAMHEPRNNREIKAWCQQMNSYMGFLMPCKTYNIRRKLYDTVPSSVKKRIVCKNFIKYNIKKKYKDVYKHNISA